MSYSFHHPCGRLCIATIASPTSEHEAASMGREFGEVISRLGSAVFATDARGCQVVSPTVADAYIRLMRSDNKYVLRAGLLVAGHGNFALQLMRLVKESSTTSNRRVFFEPMDMYMWLSEVLTTEELAAVARHYKLPKPVAKAP